MEHPFSPFGISYSKMAFGREVISFQPLPCMAICNWMRYMDLVLTGMVYVMLHCRYYFCGYEAMRVIKFRVDWKHGFVG